MAVRFATNSDFMRCASAAVTSTPCTLAAWVKSDAIGGNDVVLGVFNAAAAQDRDLLLLNINTGGSVIARAADGSAASLATSSTTMGANTWAHACAVFASSTSRAAFLNGGGKGTNATSRTPSGINRTSFARQDNASGAQQFGGGEVANAAIWDVALTDSEVALLALGLSPLLVRPEALVTYWPLYGRNSPEIDTVGRFELTLQGSTAAAAHPRVLMPRPIILPKIMAPVIAGQPYVKRLGGIAGMARAHGVAVGHW